jgi:hypothetical protein
MDIVRLYDVKRGYLFKTPLFITQIRLRYFTFEIFTVLLNVP